MNDKTVNDNEVEESETEEVSSEESESETPDSDFEKAEQVTQAAKKKTTKKKTAKKKTTKKAPTKKTEAESNLSKLQSQVLAELNRGMILHAAVRRVLTKNGKLVDEVALRKKLPEALAMVKQGDVVEAIKKLV